MAINSPKLCEIECKGHTSMQFESICTYSRKKTTYKNY